MIHDIFITLSTFFKELGIYGLGIDAVIESCLPGFIIAPDYLLIPMDLAKPDMALVYALVSTLCSVLGGSIGYCIGAFGGRPIVNRILKDKMDKFEAVEKLYEEYGSFAVFFSAFTPIPYNIFTIASGILKMNFLKFLLASLLGRGGRFFLISIVLMFFGELIKQYLNYVIIGVSVVLVLFFVVIYKKRHSIIKESKDGDNK